MREFFVALPGGDPDTSFHVLQHVFDLDAQLAAAGQTSPPEHGDQA
jgi:hypothetical protein